MLDLEPATRVLSALIEGLPEEQLTAPPPCTKASLNDLIDHVDRLSMAFTAAATKTANAGEVAGRVALNEVARTWW